MSDDMPALSPLLVVLAPDLVGRACLDPTASEVLVLWRNGQVRPVLNRSLVVRYLRVLRQLGLSEELVRRWAWWFGSGRKVLLLEPDAPGPSVIELCEMLARAAGAPWIIHAGSAETIPAGDGIDQGVGRWVVVNDFLRRALPSAKPGTAAS